MNRRPAGERGQATFELALVLPVAMLVVLLIVEAALVLRAQLLVTHAAREAARVAAVDDRPAAALRAAAGPGLDPSRLDVRVSHTASPSRVRASITYVVRTDLALVGALLPDVTLHANATMYDERQHVP